MNRTILDKLNDEQRKAVLATEGPLLILAGAGSGKTRTLTARIAHLIDQGVSPYEILAITFTNKAAGEMRTRIEDLVGEAAQRMWIYTFHAMCVQILRRNLDRLPGYTRWFSIYDDDDSQTVIKACLKELGMNDQYYKPRSMLAFISDCKNQLKSPEEAAKGMQGRDQRADQLVALYKLYEEKVRAANALDFDDILVRTLELFVECPDVLGYYQNRFRYIHVDEYQDTNMVQYELVRALAGIHGNLCVVGDDDQSIYGWRGADIRNILEFEKDFANAQVIRLEQNYRSTSTILDAANAVIAHNVGRKEKTLWSERGQGEALRYYQAPGDREEAAYICRTIQELLSRYTLSDMAVLYRTNAQSRVLEETLMRSRIAYRMVGGLRYYDRKEVKDLTAYLRLIINSSDDVSFARIVNVPRRGIGEATVTAVRQAAARDGRGIMDFICDSEAVAAVASRAAKKLKDFGELIAEMKTQAGDMSPVEFVKLVLDRSGYEQMLTDEDTDEARGRLENLGEYLSAVEQYMATAEAPNLEDFLQNVALASDWDKTEGQERAITLMTMHSAKGLEYPVVFVIGMEEGLFPHQRALIDMDQMEEERRLCYVAITRAKDLLFLTSATQRMLFGTTQYNAPSRFLREIPGRLIQQEGLGETPKESRKPAKPQSKPAAPGGLRGGGLGGGVSSMKRPQAAGGERLSPGDKVLHPTFGEGTIIAAEGPAGRRNVTVAFAGKGIKLLNEAFAPMKKITKEGD